MGVTARAQKLKCSSKSIGNPCYWEGASKLILWRHKPGFQPTEELESSSSFLTWMLQFSAEIPIVCRRPNLLVGDSISVGGIESELPFILPEKKNHKDENLYT
ncbi:hypothetical protein HS088_TW15G00034 [Tripterygium wilfordii]|uniref:Uncharacterized protein n=1 Tax=Tripterygium wilfordii TaxID=458696 RepID=A0A7J7CKG2_TRIWF|nr:hypothetical protein HS088_TW15G00034 [Tripterygium wilfordii]